MEGVTWQMVVRVKSFCFFFFFFLFCLAINLSCAYMVALNVYVTWLKMHVEWEVPNWRERRGKLSILYVDTKFKIRYWWHPDSCISWFFLGFVCYVAYFFQLVGPWGIRILCQGWTLEGCTTHNSICLFSFVLLLPSQQHWAC
jgi:hypothetical protein